MLSKNNIQWFVDKPNDDVREAILCMCDCRPLLTEVDQHSLKLVWLKEVLNELDLWFLKRWFFAHFERFKFTVIGFNVYTRVCVG